MILVMITNNDNSNDNSKDNSGDKSNAKSNDNSNDNNNEHSNTTMIIMIMTMKLIIINTIYYKTGDRRSGGPTRQIRWSNRCIMS